MNLRQLEIFLAILEHGSFSAGARACYISQSTASQAIATLEEELGSRLLERVHGGVLETPAGRIFKKHAKQILSDVGAAFDSLERQRGVAKTTLVIAASTIPCAYLVPPVLKNLYGMLPDLRVRLMSGDSRETIARVHEREADVGIVGNRFEERGLTYQPIKRDEIRLYCAKGAEYAVSGKLELSRLGEIPLIIREPGSGTAKAVGEALSDAGFDATKLKTRLQVESTEAAKAAMLCGLGATFLSVHSIERELERGDAVEIPIKGFSVSRTFFLVKRLGADPTGACQQFWDAMESYWAKA